MLLCQQSLFFRSWGQSLSQKEDDLSGLPLCQSMKQCLFCCRPFHILDWSFSIGEITYSQVAHSLAVRSNSCAMLAWVWCSVNHGRIWPQSNRLDPSSRLGHQTLFASQVLKLNAQYIFLVAFYIEDISFYFLPLLLLILQGLTFHYFLFLCLNQS